MDCSLGRWTGIIFFRACLLLLLINKVSLQEIQATAGRSVILPCSHPDPALRDKVTVFWRYRDSGTVYDIIDGRERLNEQEESFRGRVEGFPDEWKNGNFSISLSNVVKTDEGPYTCFIPAVNAELKSFLAVKGSRILIPPNRDIKGGPQTLLLLSATLLGLALLHT